MRDMLVFPIIFNYRQFLELALKYQLATYGAAVGMEPNWTTHYLDRLWGEFLDMLERYGTDTPTRPIPWSVRSFLSSQRSTLVHTLIGIR